VLQGTAEVPGILLRLLQVGAHRRPVGKLPTSLGDKLSEQPRDSGEVRQGSNQFVRAEALGSVSAPGGEASTA
jgi:hypothetical protein